MLGEQSVSCHLTYLIILFSFISILQIRLFKASKLIDWYSLVTGKIYQPFHISVSILP